MFHPADCPEWEYENFPGWEDTLLARCSALLLHLRRGQTNTLAASRDTRATHNLTFRGLVPPDCQYFAGHYRGEDGRCLKYYEVGVDGDSRVGAPPGEVWALMQEFETQIVAGLGILDAAFQVPNAQLSQRDKLINIIVFASRVFEMFLRIHPYANGNGHMARYILTCMLARYGHFLKSFPLEPRPPDPGYTNAIIAYRNGNRQELETLVLNSLE